LDTQNFVGVAFYCCLEAIVVISSADLLLATAGFNNSGDG
jgi:hypothetical protein